VTESRLSPSKDVDFIVANPDDLILGALAATKAAGLTVPMCGVDGLPEALSEITAGNLSATVFQNPEGQAAGGLTAAVWYLEGAKPDTEILIPFQLVTPDNVDKIAEIANRVYGAAAGTTKTPTFDFSGEFWHTSYTAQKEWVIGVSYQNLAFPYVAAMQKAIQNRAKELGVKLIETDAFNDTNKELANVENILAQKPDLLLFEAASLEASVASIEAANKAGVPVVQFNGKANGGEYVSFVGSNQIESGLALGQWLIDLRTQTGKDKLKGIYLRGVAGQITDIARHDGVVKALADAGLTDKFEFVEQYADYDRGKGQSVTESLLSQSKDIDFIVANNDDMILGALAATKAAGLQVPMCGVDGLPEAIAAIQSGDLSATVFQNPEGQAAGGLTAAVWYLEGAKPDTEILIPFILVTPENAAQIAEIANRVYIK
jgi:ABC-type sugar transport system substrate-binding protein